MDGKVRRGALFFLMLFLRDKERGERKKQDDFTGLPW